MMDLFQFRVYYLVGVEGEERRGSGCKAGNQGAISAQTATRLHELTCGISEQGMPKLRILIVFIIIAAVPVATPAFLLGPQFPTGVHGVSVSTCAEGSCLPEKRVGLAAPGWSRDTSVLCSELPA